MAEMTNPFLDQAKFMRLCGQSVGQENVEQYKLYLDLIKEEVQELEDSRTRTDDLDALIDIASLQPDWIERPGDG